MGWTFYNSSGEQMIQDGGLTIANNTDNYVVTATGGAGAALNGESELTYNGTSLKLAQSAAASEFITLEETQGTASGAYVALYHNSASPADNDTLGFIVWQGKDDAGAKHELGAIKAQITDVTASTMDTELQFRVSQNRNDADTNIQASLSSAGAWTDASGEANKTYEGTAHEVFGGVPGQTITDKIKTLQSGRYHASNQPVGKPISERHIGPTAEAFWDLFGVGRDPRAEILDNDGVNVNVPGLAAKDIAGVAILALQELIARVEALESKD